MRQVSLRAQRNLAVFALLIIGLAFLFATVAGRVTTDDVFSYFDHGGPVPQGTKIVGGVFALPDRGEPEFLCRAVFEDDGYEEVKRVAVFSNVVADSLPVVGALVGIDVFAQRAVRGTEGPHTEPVAAALAERPGEVIGYERRELVTGTIYEHDENCVPDMVRAANRGDRLCIVASSFSVAGDAVRKGLRFKSDPVILPDTLGVSRGIEEQAARTCPTYGSPRRWDVWLRAGLAVIDGRDLSPT